MFSVWQRPQIVWGGGDEGGSGGGGSDKTYNSLSEAARDGQHGKAVNIKGKGRQKVEFADKSYDKKMSTASSKASTGGSSGGYTSLADMFDGGGPGKSGAVSGSGGGARADTNNDGYVSAAEARANPLDQNIFSAVGNYVRSGGIVGAAARALSGGGGSSAPRPPRQRIGTKGMTSAQRKALTDAGYEVTKGGSVKKNGGTVAGSNFSGSREVDAIMNSGSLSGEASSFGDAFAEARRKAGGDGGTFTFGGKQFTTNIDRAPKTSLRPQLRPTTVSPAAAPIVDYDSLYQDAAYGPGGIGAAPFGLPAPKAPGGDPELFLSSFDPGSRPSTYSPELGGGDPALADRPVRRPDMLDVQPSAPESVRDILFQQQQRRDQEGSDRFIDEASYESAGLGDTGFGKFLNENILGPNAQLETTSGGGVASLPVPQPSPAVSVPPGRRDGPGSETEGNVYNTVLPDELIGAPMDSALQTEVRGNRAFETAPDQFGLQRRVYRGDPPDRNLTALEQGIYGLGEDIARAGDVALDYGTDFFRTIGYRGGGPGVGRADVDSDVTMAQAMAPQTDLQKAYREKVVDPAVARSQAAYDRLSDEAKAKLEGELSFDNVGTKLANMAPSIAVSTAAAVASLPAAVVAGVTLGVGGMDSQIEGAIQKEFDEGRLQNTPGFQDLKATGLSDAEAVLAYAGGISKQAAPIVASISAAGGSLSNAVLNGAVTKPLAKAISQKAAVQGATQTGRRGVVGPTVEAASRMAIEGLTEGMQEIAEAEIPSWYNDAQALKQTAAQRKESGILGFLGGSTAAGGVSVAQGLGLGPQSRVGPTIESAPKPGDPDFVGPLPSPQGPNIPVPGDPGFVGPLQPSQGPTIPQAGDPNFIGPTQPTVAAAADVLSGTIPVPGDPDFVGPLPAVPRPRSSEFIGPLQLAPVAGDPNFVGPVAPVSGDPNFVGPVGLENQRGFDPSQVDTAAAQAAAITPEAQAEFDLLVPGGAPKSVGAAAGTDFLTEAILRKDPNYLPFDAAFLADARGDLDTRLQDIAFEQAEANRAAGNPELGAVDADSASVPKTKEDLSRFLIEDLGRFRPYGSTVPTAMDTPQRQLKRQQDNIERARAQRAKTQAEAEAVANMEAFDTSLPVDPAGIGSLRNFPSNIPLTDSPAAQADRRRAIANRLKGEAEAEAMRPLETAQNAILNSQSNVSAAENEVALANQLANQMEQLQAVNEVIAAGKTPLPVNLPATPEFTTPQTKAQLAALTTPVEAPAMAPLVAASPESVGEPDIIPPMQGPSIPVQGDFNFTGPLPSLEEQLLLDLEDKGIGALKPSRIIRGGKAPEAMDAAVPVTDPEISFEEAVAKVPMPKVRSTVSALKSQEGTPPVDTTSLEPLVLTDQKIKSDLGPDPFSLENRLARQRARFAEQENELAAAQRPTPTEAELKKGVGSLDAAEDAAKRRKVPPTRRVVTGIDTERKDFTELQDQEGTPYFPELPTDDVFPPEEREGGPSGPSDDRPAVVPVDMTDDSNDAQGCPPGYRRVLDPATGRYICLKIEEGSAGVPAAPAEETEDEDVVIDIPATERPKISPYYVPEMIESNYTPYVPGRRARIFKDVAVRD